MQGIRRVGRLAVAGLDVLSPQHLQSRLAQSIPAAVHACATANVQPGPTESASLRRRVPRWAARLRQNPRSMPLPSSYTAAQWASWPERAARAGCTPPAGLALGEQVLLLQLDTARQTQALQILARTGQRTRVLVRPPRAAHHGAPARQTARPCLRPHQRRAPCWAAAPLRDQIHILPTHRRKTP